MLALACCLSQPPLPTLTMSSRPTHALSQALDVAKKLIASIKSAVAQHHAATLNAGGGGKNSSCPWRPASASSRLPAPPAHARSTRASLPCQDSWATFTQQRAQWPRYPRIHIYWLRGGLPVLWTPPLPHETPMGPCAAHPAIGLHPEVFPI